MSDKTTLAERIESLRNLCDTQCTDGNWDYDGYMHGMANGMILALAVLDDTNPAYLDAPQKWLCDTVGKSKPIEALQEVE